MEQNGLYADGVYDENGYMEQEEEWEREGLLDPAWEKQQKKVSWNCAVISQLGSEAIWNQSGNWCPTCNGQNSFELRPINQSLNFTNQTIL